MNKNELTIHTCSCGDFTLKFNNGSSRIGYRVYDSDGNCHGNIYCQDAGANYAKADGSIKDFEDFERKMTAHLVYCLHSNYFAVDKDKGYKEDNIGRVYVLRYEEFHIAESVPSVYVNVFESRESAINCALEEAEFFKSVFDNDNLFDDEKVEFFTAANDCPDGEYNIKVFDANENHVLKMTIRSNAVVQNGLDPFQANVKLSYREYLEKNSGVTPLYCYCVVMMKDTGITEDVVIKMNSTAVEPDSSEIFYRANGIFDILKLIKEDNENDFYIYEFDRFDSEL